MKKYEFELEEFNSTTGTERVNLKFLFIEGSIEAGIGSP